MPIAYLDVPDSIQNADKRKLVKRIYDALHEAYPFPDDVRIFIREWPSERVSQDGQLGSEPARPVFMIHVPQGVAISVMEIRANLYQALRLASDRKHPRG